MTADLRPVNLSVAVMRVLLDEVKDEYNRVRAAAEQVYAGARTEGTPQQEALLPGGAKLGLVAIRKPSPQLSNVDGGELIAWVAEQQPSELEPYLITGAASDRRVIDLVAEHMPELVRTRIRPGHVDALHKQMAGNGGHVVGADGVKGPKVADVTVPEPDGKFQYRPTGEARALVMAAWRAGELAGLDLGAFAALTPPQDHESIPISLDSNSGPGNLDTIQ